MIFISDIMHEAALIFGIKSSQMWGKRPSRQPAHARFAAAWAARELTGKSYPTIARAMKAGDHSTVMHRVQRAAELRATDPAFRRATDSLIRRAELSRMTKIPPTLASTAGAAR